MDLREYQRAVLRGLSIDSGVDPLAHCALGLAGEAGEVADQIKKSQYKGGSLSVMKLVEELGDSFWYLTAIAGKLGYTLDELASINIEKLKARYPERYT